MNEVTLRNESLGLSMTKATINGIDVVLAENVREALEWDKVLNMVRGLKNGKEVLKVRVSDLDSTLKGFCSNLSKTSEKGGRPLEYVYFLPRQGVARLIATRRPHDIKDNPELADKLDKLQDWIFGEVLPEVMTTGRYSGKPLVAGQHAITEMPTRLSDALRLMADEWDAHELTIGALGEVERTKALISDRKTATALQRNSVLKRRINTLEREKQEMMDGYDAEIDELRDRLAREECDASRYRYWRSHVGRKPKGWLPLEEQMSLF